MHFVFTSEVRNAVVAVLKHEHDNLLNSILTVDAEEMEGTRLAYRSVGNLISTLEQLEGDELTNYAADIDKAMKESI
ncbi:hypothetical protein ABK933_03570 [Klebsiella aerogenes]|uniref:hypothetical protein n=1 Tax=Klebsiella aerogenes TaxID=548 RepID=UPI002B26AC8E|nr:hypothetical protein [Klebsiella aerogenes]MEA8782142.1 hypothetical protein [Klebsiella aerogenes]